MSISSQIKPAHNYVPEYQQSGIPFVKTATTPNVNIDNNVITNIADFKIEFDRVTRWFIIHNHDHVDKGHLRVYFSKESAENAFNAGNNDSYFLIDAEAETNRLETKCKEIYILPDDNADNIVYSIIAGLTNILSSDFPDQTTANGFLGI